MKLNLGLVKDLDLSRVEYGDVIVSKLDVPYLVVSDRDGDDFRLVNLYSYRITDYHSTVSYCVEEMCIEVKEVIKKDNLELRRC